ncbi:MAG: PAS domain-containing sensor histidine kinase [Chitinophagales bacterium]|nr:PAS domain-containing sensor histidine kinase [Chitinophagales bacterium]
MSNFTFNGISKSKQYLLSMSCTITVAAVCYSLTPVIGYKVVALLLLVTVSLLAMFLDILPVLLAAALSALLWDFFFIPPHFTLTIGDTEDRIMLLLYFLIAALNGVLTYKIRQIEKDARDKEEKANAVKFYNTLLNSLSHELRTPITTIVGATDNLQSNSANLSDDNKRTLINEIAIAGMRLNQQVENLLNMSRIEAGFIQPKLDWCDVSELIYAAIHRAEKNLKNHTVNVYVQDGLPLFELDFVWMEQVLFNLINNAAIYTPEKTVISIKAECVNEKLLLTVTDNGKGFPEDEIGKVFDKFYRLQNSKAGGTGLGLSIVKGFVEAHHGTVRVENAQLGGARFVIEIPAKTSYLNNLKNE